MKKVFAFLFNKGFFIAKIIKQNLMNKEKQKNGKIKRFTNKV